MTMDKYDVAVVGAGPAGSRAAYAAAKEGLSVALLERHQKIGEHILCAEGLSRSTVKGYLEIKSEWIAAELEGAIVQSPSGRTLKLKYPGVGFVLERKIFDNELAQAAVQAGVHLITGAEVIEVTEHSLHYEKDTEKKKLQFKFIVAADGAESRIGRMLGINTALKLNEIHICPQYRLANLNLDASYVNFYLNNDIAPGGYAWLFPKSETFANAGLGLSPVKSRLKAEEYLARWIKKDFPDAKIINLTFGAVPAKILKKFTVKNCFLVGDAARLCDPFSGAGIANAIKSGYLAGIDIARVVKGGKSEYEKALKKEILTEIIFHNQVRNVYLKLANDDFEVIIDLLQDVFGDRVINNIDSKEIIKQALLFSPRFFKLGSRLLYKFLK